MKRVHGFLLAVLTLGLLAACTTPPITIPLDDIEIPLDTAFATGGAVVFLYDPVSLQSPPPATSVAVVTVQGQAKLSQAANLTFDIYAADTSPADLGCEPDPTEQFYVCASSEGLDKVGTIAFDNTAGPVSFQLTGDVLASGINRGALYLGTAISGTFTSGNTLTLYDMSATIQLNIGQ